MTSVVNYQKVRHVVAGLLRNRRWLLQPKRWRSRRLLHLGCGPNIFSDFVNLDYRWVPGVDVVWDLSRPLPFPPNRFEGAYTEHCLEHFTLSELDSILRELHRILLPGGRLRVVVPSLETHLLLYQDAVRARTHAPAPPPSAEPAAGLNRVFYSGHSDMARSGWFHDGHHYMHDFSSLCACLEKAGFAGVQAVECGRSADARLAVDNPARAWESLYIEAVKPADGGA